jgi:hypothetical protein
MVRFYLDFDGVIAHSAIECIHSAFIVWLEANRNLLSFLEDTKFVDLKSQVINYSISNRQLVIPPEHYYCLIDAIFHECLISGKSLDDNYVKSLFISKVKSTSPSILEKFKNNFFDFRNKKFSIQSDEDWVKENPPTLFINEFCKLIKNYPAEVFVISRKNNEAIKKWLLGMKLPIHNIYGNQALGEFQNNKFKLIESLQKKSMYSEAFFIDDMASEFVGVEWKKINVITLQAGWGYNDLKDNTQQILRILKEYLIDIFD